MPGPFDNLPTAAKEHMSANAHSHLPPHLQSQVADPGIFSVSGLYGQGPGWYHLGTGADELFLGHPGEADYFIFDFGVTAVGTASIQGSDATTHFERTLDAIVVLNSFVITAPVPR